MEITFLMNENSHSKFCVITQSADNGNSYWKYLGICLSWDSIWVLLWQEGCVALEEIQVSQIYTEEFMQEESNTGTIVVQEDMALGQAELKWNVLACSFACTANSV